MFLRLLAKIDSCLFFVYSIMSKISTAHLYIEVMVASYDQMVAILVSMERRDPYTFVPYIRVLDLQYIKSREGLQQQQPLHRGRVTENTSGGRGLRRLNWMDFPNRP